MRHQYVVVGLLSVICGLLGYIAAQLTVERSQQVQQPTQAQAQISAKQQNSNYECIDITHNNAKQNGIAKTEAFFDNEGNLTNVKLVQSSGYTDLDKDAIDFAKKNNR